MATTEDKAETTIGKLREKISEGKLPHKIFTDPDFFELEKERLFKRAWIPLGHESEIPDPGDYVVRYICDDPLIVVRDESGDVNVFYNICKHQGMEVCRTEMGNTSHFRCPYHGWTYKNSGELQGVPFKHRAYEDMDLKEIHLDEPQHDTYKGLIFACLDPDSESLDEFLGDFKFYLDFVVGRSPNGMEVFGPQRRIINANWKLGAMNTMSDHYHSATTHRSASEIELSPRGLGTEIDDPRWHMHADAGGLMIKESHFFPKHPLRDMIKETLSDQQWELISGDLPRNGNGSLLPNTNILMSLVRIEEEEEAVPITYLRNYRPLAPDKTEVFTWAVVEKDAPEELKERSRKGYEFGWGISGLIEQDDLGNWTSVTQSGKGTSGGDHDLKIDMKLEDEPVDWPYPGEAYQAPFHEVNMRYFYDWICEYLEDEPKNS